MSTGANPRLESYKQQRMKTPANKSLAKQDNIKAIRQLEEIIVQRISSNLAKHQSTLTLSSANSPKAHSRVNSTNILEESSIQNNQSLLNLHSEICLTGDSATRPEEATLLSRQISYCDLQTIPEVSRTNLARVKSSKQFKKPDLLRKYTVMESKRPLVSSKQPTTRQNNSKSAHSRGKPQVVRGSSHSGHLKASKVELGKFLQKVQGLKSQWSRSGLLRNPQYVAERFQQIIQCIKKQIKP